MEKRARIIAKAIAIAVVLIVVYVFLPSISSLIENPPGATYMILPQKVEFQFERIIDISARTYTINLTIPSNSPYQKLSVEDMSSYPKSVNNGYNRTWWSYSLSGASQIRIKYTGTTYTKVWHIKTSDGVDKIPQSLKEQYNHREYLESSGTLSYVIDPEPFKEITSNITKGDSSVVGKLRDIYDFMVENFHYKAERTGAPNTAVQTWNAREGDCDELSFVFVSMARSIGIPAWVEYGFLYDGSTWGQHAWVGTVVPHDGKLDYVNIDVTAEVGRKDLGRGFLIRDPFRITEWVEDGNSKHLSSYYNFLTYTSPPDLTYHESINVLQMNEEGQEKVFVGNGIPSWLMFLIFLVIILVVIVIIIRW